MHYKLQHALCSCCHQFIMESPVPSVSISIAANDGEVHEAPHELIDSRLVPVRTNKTSLVWQYFITVKDGLNRCNGIQYVLPMWTALATCTWRTYPVTMRSRSGRGCSTRISSTHSRNASTCTWPCAEWSGRSRTRRPSRAKSTTESATNISATMWTTTRASQAMCACTSKHYAANGRCTSTLLTRSCRCATPTSCRMSIGSSWPRLRPSFDQFAPCRSQCRSTCGSSPARASPMSSRPRLPPSTWLT